MNGFSMSIIEGDLSCISFNGTDKQQCDFLIGSLSPDIAPIDSGKIISFIQRSDNGYFSIQTTDAVTEEQQIYLISSDTDQVRHTTVNIPLWVQQDKLYCIMDLDNGEQALCEISFSEEEGILSILTQGYFYGCWINVINNVVYLINRDDGELRMFDIETNTLVDLSSYIGCY